MSRDSIIRRVELGTAELVPDPYRPGGWTVLVDGVAQSYVNVRRPAHLEFEYVRRVAAVVAACPSGPLRVLHLGGGGMTIPRYIAHVHPGAQQLVVERDSKLLALVLGVLPLPDGAGVRAEAGDARSAVEGAADGSYDLVIGDVYRGALMERSTASTEFVSEVARVLAPGGFYAVNVTDLPPLAFSRAHAATLLTEFRDVALLSEPGMMRGKRFGNLVFAAAAAEHGLPAKKLSHFLAADKVPGRLVRGTGLAGFIGDAEPQADASF
ncbi:spermidine synthase [Longispora albida]|uniref:spermidine synthase n=1 Tax=Longispora albida TaxID=203523 RepID=UPI000A2EF5A8|nr:fused MFS/spermidine synthase [Longispora albida]